MNENKLLIPKQDYLLICFFCNTYYICVADYKKALFWLNEIINDKSIDTTTEIYGISRILQLIIHYELENYEILPYLIRNTNRYFRSKKQLFQFEKMILNFFKKLQPFIQHKKMNYLFKELKEQFQQIIHDPYEEEILDFFDFMSWLDSKIEGKPFAEVVRRKVGSKQ